VLVIEKNEMFKVLHEEHGLSDRFIEFMLARNIRIEEDLIDQLFNSSGKRKISATRSFFIGMRPGGSLLSSTERIRFLFTGGRLSMNSVAGRGY
jgi:hypothetical protein